MPLDDRYTTRRVSPGTVLSNAYGALVNALKNAARPERPGMPLGATPLVSQAQDPLRQHQLNLVEARRDFERRYDPDTGMPRRTPGFADALTTNPQEVLSGAIGTLGAAGLVSGSARSAMKRHQPGMARTFLGANSETADLKALEAAKAMKAEGVPDRDIWRVTGWGQGPDGNWVYEISDEGMRFKPEVQEYMDRYQKVLDSNPGMFKRDEAGQILKDASGRAVRQPPEAMEAWQKLKADTILDRPSGLQWKANRDINNTGLTGRAEDLMEHPELFQAYPRAKDTEVSIGFLPTSESLDPKHTRVYGSYSPQAGRINLGERLPDEGGDYTFRQPLVHEMQHRVQQLGGRQGGASYNPNAGDMTKSEALQKLQLAIRTQVFPSGTAFPLENPDAMWSMLKGVDPVRLRGEPEDFMRALYGTPRSAYEKYRATPGELEAFSTQNRLEMTAEQRRNLPPWEQPSYKQYAGAGDPPPPVTSFLGNQKAQGVAPPPDFAVNPRRLQRLTKEQGGATVHAKTGEAPTEGFAVKAFPAKTKVVDGPLKQSDIQEFMRANKDVLANKDNYLSTWYDPTTGKTHLDVAKRYDDAQKAFKAAEKKGQLSIADLGTGETLRSAQKWDDWVKGPEFGNRLDEMFKLGDRSIRESGHADDWWETAGEGNPWERIYGTESRPQQAGFLAATAPSSHLEQNVQAATEYMRRHVKGEPIIQPDWRSPTRGNMMPMETRRAKNLEHARAGNLQAMRKEKVRNEALAIMGDQNALVFDTHWSKLASDPASNIYSGPVPNRIPDDAYGVLEDVVMSEAKKRGLTPSEFAAKVWTGIREQMKTGQLYGQKVNRPQGSSLGYAHHFDRLIKAEAEKRGVSVAEIEEGLRKGDTSLFPAILAPVLMGDIELPGGDGNE